MVETFHRLRREKASLKFFSGFAVKKLRLKLFSGFAVKKLRLKLFSGFAAYHAEYQNSSRKTSFPELFRHSTCTVNGEKF